MVWQGWMVFGLILCWVAPGAIWRRSSLALLIAWSIAEVYYQITGISIPVALYLVADLAVIAVILLSRKHWTDWAILSVFPLMWFMYFAPGPFQPKWDALLWLAVFQFILAGPWPAFQKIKGSVDHGGIRKKDALAG